MAGKATPKNPNGVAVGQVWGRRVHPNAKTSSDLVIEKVDLRKGVAVAVSTEGFQQFGGKPRVTRIRLDRFTKGGGYYLKKEAA